MTDALARSRAKCLVGGRPSEKSKAVTADREERGRTAHEHDVDDVHARAVGRGRVRLRTIDTTQLSGYRRGMAKKKSATGESVEGRPAKGSPTSGDELAAGPRIVRRKPAIVREQRTPIGRIPLGAVAFRLRKQTADGSFVALTAPSDDGTIEVSEWRPDDFSAEFIASNWGVGVYRALWLIVLDGKRLPPQHGNPRDIILRAAEEQPVAPSNAMVHAPPSSMQLPPEFGMMRFFQEMQAAQMQTTMTMVTALATALRPQAPTGESSSTIVQHVLEQQAETNRRLYALLGRRRDDDDRDDDRDDDDRDDGDDDDDEKSPPQNWEEVLDDLRDEVFSEIGDAAPALMQEVKAFGIEKALEWKAKREAARLQANGTGATPKG